MQSGAGMHPLRCREVEMRLLRACHKVARALGEGGGCLGFGLILLENRSVDARVPRCCAANGRFHANPVSSWPDTRARPERCYARPARPGWIESTVEKA